jgi:hypothetical protein
MAVRSINVDGAIIKAQNAIPPFQGVFMQIKKVTLSELFAWLLASFRLIGEHPGRFALASLVSLLAVLAIVLVFSMLAAFIWGDTSVSVAVLGGLDVNGLLSLYAVVFAIAILAAPPFIAGWFVFCRKLANGADAELSDLFSGYGNSAQWRKLIGYAAISMALYVLAHVLYIGLCVALGFSAADFQNVMQAQVKQDPNALASLPSGFWLAYAGVLFLGFFLQTLFMLGFAQAVLTESSASEALKAGMAGTLKNLPALLLFLLITLLLAALAMLLFIVVMVLAATLLAFLNQYLAMLAVGTLYLVLILYIYPLMFSFQYFCWRGILGDDTAEHSATSSGILL